MSCKRNKRETAQRLELEGCIKAVNLQLAQAYAGFNAAADGELVESYIFEIQALQTRYSYLLRQRKALEEGFDPDAAPKSARTALPVA